jgi:hypothetical protein
MSYKLISQPIWLHDFRDDLESSFYVLLWVTLMYSTCTLPERVIRVLEDTLDPQPHAPDRIGYSKADFLLGMSFLRDVEFPDRPRLHNLLVKLAVLFSSRYEKAVSTADAADLPSSELDPLATDTREHRQTVLRRLEMLEDHGDTISLFNEALADRSKWPIDDNAIDQGIRSRTAVSRSEVLPIVWLSSVDNTNSETDVNMTLL